MVGLAPTNAVAQDLKADGFTEAGTAHAALFRLKNGRTRWDRRTVVIVDEAAMLDSPRHRRAVRRGAAGRGESDPRRRRPPARQHRARRAVHRAAASGTARRKSPRSRASASDWQRQAARDLAEGRFAEAVAAFDQAGAITWTRTRMRRADRAGRGLESATPRPSPTPRASCSPTPTATWTR